MAGVIYGKDYVDPGVAMLPGAEAFLQGLEQKRRRQMQDAALEQQRQQMAQSEQETKLRGMSALAEQLARNRQQQIQAAQLLQGQPGGAGVMPEGVVGPPEPERFHPAQPIQEYTDPMTGQLIPGTRVQVPTDYGMEQAIIQKNLAENLAKIPLEEAKAEGRQAGQMVPAPFDVPELGIRKGQPVDKDTVSTQLATRRDERGEKMLSLSEQNSRRAADTAAQSKNTAMDQKGFENAAKVRAEFTKATNAYKGVQEKVRETIEGLTASGSAVTDRTLVTNISKVLDPMSVVRESEYDRYTKMGSVLERIKAKYGNLKEGTILTPDIRKQLIGEMQRLGAMNAQFMGESENYYKDIAETNGVDWARVVGSQRSGKSTAKAPASKSGWSFERVK